MKFRNIFLNIIVIVFYLFFFIIFCLSKEDENVSKDYIERMCADANACFRNGFIIEAREKYIKLLKEYEKVPNKDLQYIEILLNAGFVSIKLGEYQDAEKYLLKAKELCSFEKNTYSKNYEVSIYYYLGHLYSSMGIYAKAKENYLYSQKIDSLYFGNATANNILYVSCIGSQYISLHDEKGIDEYLHKALNIYNNVEGLNIEDSLDLLMYIGVTYLEQKKYKNAESVYLQILEMTNDDIEIERRMIILNNIGYLYYKQNDYVQAEKYYNELEDSYLYAFKADFLVNIADVYFKLNKWEEASDSYIKASVLAKQQYYGSLDYMTESEREYYWTKLNVSFEKRYPLFIYKYHFINPFISTFAYDNELFSKGLLLSSLSEIRNSILKSGDRNQIKRYDELVLTKKVVMHLEEREPQSKVLDRYRQCADSLEKIVTKSSAVFRESKEQWNINWESVKKQLSKNEVAIEYFTAPLNQDSTMYCALLLRHNSKYPELIPLFEEKEVTDITSTINESIDNSLLYNYNKYGAILSEKVWSKILPRVKEGETIYFSPSGLLLQLAIEFLPVDSARTMSDVYSMIRLSSTRELALNKKQTSNTRATVYGGISYTLDKEIMQTESRRYASQERSIDADTLNRGTVIDLPETLVEAKYIDSLLVANNITTTLFTSEKANEESFKALSGKGNRILHIATHGFTWTDSIARKQDYFASRIQMIGDNLPKGQVIDPLNRCGLLFAGANTAYQGRSRDLPEGVQDGILTAKEISLMDLRGTELVVLSACETAQGDITSEGVFGLQRAFKMAGAKTIIMSLWEVDDNATQLLMTEFYTNWITKKQQKREAFRNAQNAVRYYKDKYGDYIYLNKPYYWAGFIMLD